MTLPELAGQIATRMDHLCSELLPNGKRVGRQWVVGDILGAAGTSCYIEMEGEKAGFWFDHAASEGGDALDLIQRNRGLPSVGQAAKWARQWLGLPEDNGRPQEMFDPLRKGFKRANESTWRNGTAAWPYHDAEGQVIAYAVRFEIPKEDGTMAKDVMPLRFLPGEGELPDPTNPKLWRWKGWKAPEKTPLFALHRLAQKPDAPVLVVEGEKTAAAAQKLFPEFIVTTWQGGSSRVERADLEPLLQRQSSIVLWPDADSAGRKAMTYLKARFPAAKLVQLPATLPDGWDLADPVPDGISVRGLLDATLNPPAPTPEPELRAPYRCLGHDEDGFHYLSHRFGSVVSLSAADHTEMNLQLIADDAYWLACGFFKADSTGVDYRSVAKHLLSSQAGIGYYDTDRMRGIGCWIEQPSDYPPEYAPPGPVVVYHAGDRLYVGGIETAIEAHPSCWIYPKRRRLSLSMAQPLAAAECQPLLELCELAPWSQTESNMPWMLAAMVFVAPICGAMDWRPSIWLTGGQGSGKTWTYANVLAPLLGDAVIKAQSCTTEAGIRQTLHCDALPVIMDEIEGNTDRSQGRIQSLLELVRQASSESGGSIYKGTAFGGSRRYRIRSSFIFSSIASGVSEAADEARIARLEFSQKAQVQENFLRMKEIAASFTPEFCGRFRARAITKAPLIREAATIFMRAIADVARDSRKGQQYGTLAASYWLLTSETVPTPEEAAGWAQSVNWDDKGAGDHASSDEYQCLDVILQYRLRIQDNEGKSWERTVMELIHSVFENTLESERAEETLTRWGIYPKRFCKGQPGGVVDIALRHTEIDKITKGTQYATKHGTFLLRINGATKDRTTITGGKTMRVIRIPKESLIA